jgi:hypothetical protein
MRSLESRSNHGLARLVSIALIAVAAAGAGCSADDSHSENKRSPARSAADAGQNDSAIVVVERVFAPDKRLYYVSVLPEMPQGKIDRSQARELGSADIEVYDGKLFVRDRDDNTMTRFAISADNQLVEEAQLSFADIGLQARRYHNIFASPERAYVMSNTDWKLFEWDPSTMEITGNEISIEVAKKPAGVDGFVSEAVKAGDRYFAPVNWQNYEELVMYPGSGALVFDAKLEQPPELIEDPRVGAGSKLELDEEGNTYLLGAVRGEIIKFGSTLGDGPTPATGVLRIRKGEKDFDPEYFVNLDEITRSPNIWGMHMIDATHLLVQMWDPEVSSESAVAPGDLDDALEFIYAIVDTEAKTWKRVDAIDKAGAGNSYDQRLDGKLYVQAYISTDADSDAQDAVVYSVTPDGVEEAFRVPGGDLWMVERIR